MKTCETYSKGEYGSVGLGTRTKKLHYLNSFFHRIVDGFVIQGGDITNGDGTGVCILSLNSENSYIFKLKRVIQYMEKLLLMRIFKEDMLVQDYYQWPIKEEIRVLVNFS